MEKLLIASAVSLLFSGIAHEYQSHAFQEAILKPQYLSAGVDATIGDCAECKYKAPPGCPPVDDYYDGVLEYLTGNKRKSSTDCVSQADLGKKWLHRAPARYKQAIPEKNPGGFFGWFFNGQELSGYEKYEFCEPLLLKTCAAIKIAPLLYAYVWVWNEPDLSKVPIFPTECRFDGPCTTGE